MLPACYRYALLLSALAMQINLISSPGNKQVGGAKDRTMMKDG
jgi:hypothetical protein